MASRVSGCLTFCGDVHAAMLEVIMTKNTSSRLLFGLTVTPLVVLVRIFHELLSRDHEDGCATWQPQGVGSEAYLNGTSQGPTPEDARKDGHIRGCSK